MPATPLRDGIPSIDKHRLCAGLYNRPLRTIFELRELWFQVANRDKRYSNKEFVIGLKVSDVARVWHYSELNKAWESDPVRESIEGFGSDNPLYC